MKMKIPGRISLAVACGLAFAALPSYAADAGDPAAGKSKNAMCIGCHGIGGYKTVFPEVYHVPKIGGQHAAYIVKALQEQAAKLWHVSNLFRVREGEVLADRLCQESFADYAFFCNSGAEAMECALKVARRYHQAQGAKEKHRIITARGAFHGRTLATIAAGGQEKHLDGFAPKMEGFDQVALGNLNEARAAVTRETAAIVVEPVQGEGGVLPCDPDYLRGLRAMADEFANLFWRHRPP